MNMVKKFLLKSTFGCLIFALMSCAEMSLDQAIQTGLQVTQAVSQNGQSNYGEAIKETLELSSTRAAGSLSKAGGYSNNPLYKIAMPEQLNTVTTLLRTFGLSKQVNNVENLMNQGAEQAAIEAKGVFVNAVKQMSITDALGIIQGSQTAATDYFKVKTEQSLRSKYLPVIQNNLKQVGFYNEYKSFLSAYNTLPGSKPDLDLEQHVLDQSLKGLFSQVAKEEALIRQDPVGKGSALLGTVFSQK